MSVYKELSKYFDHYSLKLSISKKGRQVFELLGVEYLKAVVEPLVIACPQNKLSISFLMQNQEPVHPLNDMGVSQFSTSRDPNCVGYLYMVPKADIVLNEVCAHALLPTAQSFVQTQKYEFFRPGGFIKNKIGALYYKMYRFTPVLLDTYKQNKSDKHLRNTVFEATSPALQVQQPVKPVAKNAPAMWVAMHWLEKGGAESWAIEQARLAHEAGYKVYVTTDRQAPQRLFEKISQFAEKILLPSSIISGGQWSDFAINFIEKYGITDIHIHHSAMVYALLPKLKTIYPHLHVEDSTHIVEYRGGGFVGDSIAYSNSIDLHHVISPALADLYASCGIDESKVFYRPLTGFTTGATQLDNFTQKKLSGPLRVGFLGRYSIQKRPFLFLYLVKLLSSCKCNDFEFFMQGSGELDGNIKEMTARLRLGNKIKFLDWAPAADFFDKVDVLVVPSENEGLTLTSLEADAHGVLVVSSNVGSQRTVITDEALLPKSSVKFILQAVKLLKALAKDPAYYNKLLKRQHKLVSKVLKHQSASQFYKQHYENCLKTPEKTLKKQSGNSVNQLEEKKGSE